MFHTHVHMVPERSVFLAHCQAELRQSEIPIEILAMAHAC
jgi:hypothetical protein